MLENFLMLRLVAVKLQSSRSSVSHRQRTTEKRARWMVKIEKSHLQKARFRAVTLVIATRYQSICCRVIAEMIPSFGNFNLLTFEDGFFSLGLA